MSEVIERVAWLPLPRLLAADLYRIEPFSSSGRDVHALMSEVNGSAEINMGFADWRLPTLNEIKALSDQGLNFNKTFWTCTRHREGFKVFNPCSGYTGVYSPKCYLSVLPVRC